MEQPIDLRNDAGTDVHLPATALTEISARFDRLETAAREIRHSVETIMVYASRAANPSDERPQ